MIKVDWVRFMHDHFWFGWYIEYDYGLFSRKTHWHRNKYYRRKPMKSRYPSPGVSVTVHD